VTDHDWPEWWTWELELPPHLLKRMIDRGFNETDLRAMLDAAAGHRPDHEAGRYVITTRHAGGPWEVIVEPDARTVTLVVLTAYGVG